MGIYEKGDIVRLVDNDSTSTKYPWTDLMKEKFGGKTVSISATQGDIFSVGDGYTLDLSTSIYEVIEACRKPEFLKEGDVVRLTKNRPTFWNNAGRMDKFLGAEMIVQWSGEHTDPNGNIRFTDPESSDWVFKITDVEVVVIRSKEALEEYSKRAAIVLGERYKSIEIAKDAAIDIFGEDRVWVKKAGPLQAELYIKFPEITVSNSREEKINIKGMIVRISIRILSKGESGLCNASITIGGSRYNYSPVEYRKKYTHSHLPQNLAGFHEFCLGASDFKMVMESLKLDTCEENWYLFLLSIERYLSWESLEGGPYVRISDLKDNKEYDRASVIRDSIKHLLHTIPEKLWDVDSEFALSWSLSESIYDLMVSNPVMKKGSYSGVAAGFNKTEAERTINSLWGGNGIPWKDGFIPVTVQSQKTEREEEKCEITPEMAEFVTSELSSMFNKFRTEKIKQYAKQRNYSESIGRLDECKAA